MMGSVILNKREIASVFMVEEKNNQISAQINIQLQTVLCAMMENTEMWESISQRNIVNSSRSEKTSWKQRQLSKYHRDECS